MLGQTMKADTPQTIANVPDTVSPPATATSAQRCGAAYRISVRISRFFFNPL
jgi:hypothetical protein